MAEKKEWKGQTILELILFALLIFTKQYALGTFVFVGLISLKLISHEN